MYDIMQNILISFIGSAFVIILLYLLYWLSSRKCSKTKAYAECWWLPGWNCYRFVIRNRYPKDRLSCIKYNAWLRSIHPSKSGSSVETFDDINLTSGERLLLPENQDLPMLCFRFHNEGSTLNFIHTNKKGEKIAEYDMQPGQDAHIVAEYYVKIQRWFLFKHEIVRLFEIPRYLDVRGTKTDIFQHFLKKQDEQEQEVPLISKTAEVISVAV